MIIYNPPEQSIHRLVLDSLRYDPAIAGHESAYHEKGALTRAIREVFLSIDNLESRVRESGATTVCFPAGNHTLHYGFAEGVFSIAANLDNRFSHRQDGKFVGMTKIQDTHGIEHDVQFLALEVYRTKGKSIWDLGYYVSEANEKFYAEELVVELKSDTNERLRLLHSICDILLHEIHITGYRSRKPRIIHAPSHMKYLKRFVDRSKEENPYLRILRSIKDNGKRERYAVGTEGPLKLGKFETADAIYRVELISPYPDDSAPRFYVEVIYTPREGRPVDHKGQTGIVASSTDFKQANALFIAEERKLLSRLYHTADKRELPFDITPDADEFKYATIVKDKKRRRVTVTSWESSVKPDGTPMPWGEAYHRLRLFNGRPTPLVLTEDNFPERDDDPTRKKHPRELMPGIIRTISEIEYDVGETIK